MTYRTPLSRLLVGWQKVANMYKVPVHVFQTGDTYLAVSNDAEGVRHLVQTLAPGGPPAARRQHQCEAQRNRRQRPSRLGSTASREKAFGSIQEHHRPPTSGPDQWRHNGVAQVRPKTFGL